MKDIYDSVWHNISDSVWNNLRRDIIYDVSNKVWSGVRYNVAGNYNTVKRFAQKEL